MVLDAPGTLRSQAVAAAPAPVDATATLCVYACAYRERGIRCNPLSCAFVCVRAHARLHVGYLCVVGVGVCAWYLAGDFAL